MADIKVKKKGDIAIKTLDRTAIMSSKLKENIVDIRDKTKESYETNENSSQEYAGNKIQNKVNSTAYYTGHKGNQIGRRSFKETKENIKKGKETISKIKGKIQKAKEIKKAGEKTVKTAKRTVKATKKTIKTAEKTAKVTIKTTKQAVKTTTRVAKRTVQMAKATAKATIKAIQVAVKVTVATVKAIIAATQALISAIIAGGWVAVLIIVIIALIAMICTSIFGIFFSSEESVGGRTMSSVISEINTEFTNKITDIQKNTSHDEYEISSNRAEWKDILSVYAVLVSNGDEQTDLITLDDTKISQLKSVFWEMNVITYSTQTVEKEIETTDENGNTKKEKVKRKILYINITSKSVDEMIQIHNFNDKQKIQLAELQKDEYNSMWSCVVYGSSIGSTDIVQVALAQVGNVGGQPYWSWYGFNSRVEWCACFVSWCANECGYIESGVIPKFAGCESEGVSWFKTCGLWQNGGYTPKARRYYFL